MQVDNKLKTMVTSPGDGASEVSELSLDIGLSARDIPSPKADRQANVVQPKKNQSNQMSTWRFRKKKKTSVVWMNTKERTEEHLTPRRR
jgi:hypothetical protein